ncbi:MAG: uroporphyrinogen decarboxylase family protein [Spirochaetales bacterium]|nr:uroporphyrinogen decarboxylase family protein [Spirochaetales bacterium]
MAAARGQQTDILPVAPYMGNHAARVAGIPLGEYYTNPVRLAEAQRRAWELYHQDVLVVQSDNYYMAEAFGCLTEHYPDSLPTMKKTIITEISDIARLKRPDPRRDGRMPMYLEAMEVLRRQMGPEVALRGCGTGPFVMAGHLMGPEKLILELANIEYGLGGDPQALHALFEITLETLIEFVSLQLEAGADIVQCADSLASIDVISPAMYDKYVWPYEKRFFEEVNPLCRKHGAVSLLHICGNNTKVFGRFAELGADIVAIDHKADLATAKEVIGGHSCLIGNLDPTSVLLQGNVDEVQRQAEACIAKAARNGGFILGSGCEVAIDTPRENIQVMIRTARAHSYR